MKPTDKNKREHDDDPPRKPRERLQIAIPTTERWRVGQDVAPESGGAAEGGRIIRVRADQRASARKPPPPRRAPRVQEQEEPRPPRSTASHTSGRSGLVVEGELARLLRERPELDSLRPSDADLVQAFGRLADADRERWLGMRNGRPRPLRPPVRIDVLQLTETFAAIRAQEKSKTAQLAVDRAVELLQTDPNLLWNLMVEAELPERATKLEATPQALLELLPTESPLGIELPYALAVSLLPFTARWRVGRLLSVPATDRRFREEASRRARALLTHDLRLALCELAGRAGLPAPKVHDESAWSTVVLVCLRELIQLDEGHWAVVVERPAEQSTYVAVSRDLLAEGRPWLAELAASTGMAVTSDPAKVLKHQTEAREALTHTKAILVSVTTDTGFGAVVRPPGVESVWECRWTEHEVWPDTTAVERLGLPTNVVTALLAEGLSTVGRVRAARQVDLLRLEGLGRAGLQAIEKALRGRPT